MSSTRKQKAKEKRSRQSDVMSDLENWDVMLGNFPEKSLKYKEKMMKMEETQG